MQSSEALAILNKWAKKYAGTGGGGGAVSSVNTKVGAVVLTTSDIAEGTNLYYTNTRVSANSDVVAAKNHLTNTSNPHSVTKTQVGLGNVQNIDTTNASNITTGTLPSTQVPIATSTTLGGVKVGSGINVSVDGTVSVTPNMATTSATGVVKVGNGLSVDGTGLLATKLGIGLKYDGSYAVVPDPINIDVTQLKNFSSIITGSPKGFFNNSATLSTFSSGVKADFWIFNGSSGFALGGVTFNTGDQLWVINTFTGAPANLTTNHAYVANTVATATTTSYGTVKLGSATPLMNSGTASVGSSVAMAREDHVHPSDTNKISKIASSTNNAIVTWSGTTGNTLADSAKLLPTGLVVGDSDTQTLTNKTLLDNATTIANSTDTTKKAKFDTSGITTATTRTYTMPDKNGIVALSSDAANAPLWVQTNSYRQYDLVTYSDGSIYEANANIPANTTWSVGSSGATWKQVGGNSNHIMKSANFTVEMGKSYAIDCSSSAITVSLPTTATLNIGDTFRVFDIKSNSATNNITIDFTTANQQLKGTSSNNFVINTNGCYTLFTWDGNSWQFSVLGNTSGVNNIPDLVKSIADIMYPIGHILMTENSANPNTYLGVGTWVQYGAGRVPVGIDTTQTEFNTVAKTGGAKTHTLNTSEMPAHAHSFYVGGGGSNYTGDGHGTNTGWGYTTNGIPQTTYPNGSSLPHNNLQPYIVCYMWKRTA